MMLINKGVISPVGPRYERQTPDDPTPPGERVVLARFVLTIGEGGFFKYAQQVNPLELTLQEGSILSEWGYGTDSVGADVGSSERTYLHPEVNDIDLNKALQKVTKDPVVCFTVEEDDPEEGWEAGDVICNDLSASFPNENVLTIDFSAALSTIDTAKMVKDPMIQIAGQDPIPFANPLVFPVDAWPPPLKIGTPIEITGIIADDEGGGDITIGHSVPVPGHGMTHHASGFIHGQTGKIRSDYMFGKALTDNARGIVASLDDTASTHHPAAMFLGYVFQGGDFWTVRAGQDPVRRILSGVKHVALATHSWASTSTPSAIFFCLMESGEVALVSTSGSFYGGVNNMPPEVSTPGSQVISIAGHTPRWSDGRVDLFAALTAGGDLHVWGDTADSLAWPKKTNIPGALSVTIRPKTGENGAPDIMVLVEGGSLIKVTPNNRTTVRTEVIAYEPMIPLYRYDLTPGDLYIAHGGRTTLESNGLVQVLAEDGIMLSGGVVRANGEYVRATSVPRYSLPGVGPVSTVYPFSTKVPVKVPSYVPASADIDLSWYQPMGPSDLATPVDRAMVKPIQGNGAWFMYLDKRGAPVFCDISQYITDLSSYFRVSATATYNQHQYARATTPRSAMYLEGIMAIAVNFTTNENNTWEGQFLSDVFTRYDGGIVSLYLNAEESNETAGYPKIHRAGPTKGAAMGLFYVDMAGQINKLFPGGDGMSNDNRYGIPDKLQGRTIVSFVWSDEKGTGARSWVNGMTFKAGNELPPPVRGTGMGSEVLGSFLLDTPSGDRELAYIRAVERGDPGTDGQYMLQYQDIPNLPVDRTVHKFNYGTRVIGYDTRYGYYQIYDREGTDAMKLVSPYFFKAAAKDTTGRMREFNTPYRKDLSLRTTGWGQDGVFYREVENGPLSNEGGYQLPAPANAVRGGILASDRSKVVLKTMLEQSVGPMGVDPRYAAPYDPISETPASGLQIDFGRELFWVSAEGIRKAPNPGGTGVSWYVVTAAATDGSVRAALVKSTTTISGKNLSRVLVLQGSVREILPPGTVNLDYINGYMPTPAKHWGHGWNRKFGE